MNVEDEINELMSYDIVRFVPLTKGKVAVVDRWCYDEVIKHSWAYNSDGYAVRRVGGKNQKLHRLILELAGHDITGLDVDHHNQDTIDCRSINLRPCTRSQNEANKRKRVDNTSDRNGVSWHEQGRKWRATIGIDGKQSYLGLFDDKDNAADAYDAAAWEHYGLFARLNTPKKLFYETQGPPILERPPYKSLPQPDGRRRRK